MPDQYRGIPETRLRLASAALLAPPVLWAAFSGGWPAYAVAAACAAAASVEWARLSGDFRDRVAATACIPILAVAATASESLSLGYGLALLAGLASCLTATGPHRKVAAAGLAYATLFGSALAALSSPAAPAGALPWLLAVVWASDTGAYVAGRSFGGRRLAPTISPGKTWSGLAGAVVSAAAAGALGAWLGAGVGSLGFAAATGAAFGFLGQCADLLESSLKRLAGVKDSGRLIPGHGGMLDRVDALMTCAPALAFLVGLH